MALQGQVWATYLPPLSPTDGDNRQVITDQSLGRPMPTLSHLFLKIPKDVALAIAYARKNHLPIAIRSRSYSTAGASAAESLVTDLCSHLSTKILVGEGRTVVINWAPMTP